MSAFFVRLIIIISSPAISELFLLLHAFENGRKWNSKWWRHNRHSSYVTMNLSFFIKSASHCLIGLSSLTPSHPVSQLVLGFQPRIIQSLWKDTQTSDAVAQEPLLYLRTVTFTSFPFHFTSSFLHSFFKRFDTEYMPCKIGKECGGSLPWRSSQPRGGGKEEMPVNH